MKLSILIPTMSSRRAYLDRLFDALNYQIAKCSHPNEVEILTDFSEGTTGHKSNMLMQRATGTAIARFDDDDVPGEFYIQKGLDFADSDKDTASLIGLYFLNGVYDRPFLHSIKYSHWYQDNQYYYRCNNHLNFVKRDLVKDILYPDLICGEDGIWSMKVKESGVLKTEYQIKETLYLYYARTK